MQSISWDIVPVQGAEVGVLGLRVEDTREADAPWPLYFTGINAVQYPTVIEAAVQEVGSAGEYTGVNFPGDLDEGDIAERGPLPSGTVEVYHHNFGQTIMPRNAFYAVLLAFGEQLVGRPGQPQAWYTAMQTALGKLRIKMAADVVS